MENFNEMVATENANTLIDAMVKNYINDFYGKPENELVFSKVHKYLELVNGLIEMDNRDFEDDLLAIMADNLYKISGYLTTLYNREIMPMAFEIRVSDCLHNIKSAIQTYVKTRDKMFN